ncbi:unnamed protein product [Amoebophrya sp. A25]|nr:unnamed protein product [Amoebophrya sp. A25]|eukprot:GSA25T00010941001.1
MSFYCLDLTGMGLWIFLFGGMLPFLGLIFILMIMLPTSMACFGLCPATAAVVVPTMTKVVVNVVVFLCVSIYLVFYFQMIIGGKHRRNQFSIDDYALAASCLFLEIIELFLLMLKEQCFKCSFSFVMILFLR